GERWLPLQLRAAEDGYAIDLQLDSSRPKVLQGEDGFSQKHPDGGGSYYYSQPFLEARGDIKFNGQVVAVQGSAWLDREWSSQFLKADQLGWDWFALHLESGEKLMLFRLRGVPGSNRGDFKHGVLIEPSGAKRQLDPETIGFREISRSTVAGRELPLYWRISLGELGRELEVRALHPDQWMDVDFAYWEGVVTVSGEGPGNRGVGYLEMTGYTPR
ncbi:MAG: iron ABC transporter permease, partial [Gammaproteobacteria bacterium]|nr:iron ABC transporter permease [Gammaproteobacteria bacterium]